MIDQRAEELRDRTDAKIRYAAVHLDEISSRGHPDGSDYDHAHQESFLYHLFGARDAFLAELNLYYGSALPNENLTQGKLREALAAKGVKSTELAILYTLEADSTSWLSLAKAMRDHASHVSAVARAYFLGGEDHRKVKLRDPRNGVLVNDHFPNTFQEWLKEMSTLVET